MVITCIICQKKLFEAKEDSQGMIKLQCPKCAAKLTVSLKNNEIAVKNELINSVVK